MTQLAFWEQLGLTIFATLIQHLHFDPTNAGLLKNILTPIRDALNLLYPPEKL